MLLRAIIDFLL